MTCAFIAILFIADGYLLGLAVASRLAEVSSFKILVIEAGPDARYDPVINDPGQ